ncbi:ComEC/Rec2 family competence protein [Sinomicrobium sp.]
MLPWNYNSFRLLLPLCSGIVIGFNYAVPPGIALYIAFVLLLLLGISHYSVPISGRTDNQVFTVLAFVLLCCIGLYRVNVEKPQYTQNHYSHFIQGNDSLTITLINRLKPTLHNQRYTARVDEVNGKTTQGTILCHISLQDTLVNAITGCSYTVKGNIRSIHPPRNPHQFDYRSYLQRRLIYHQLYLDSSGLRPLPGSENNLYSSAGTLRKSTISLLRENGVQGDVLALTQALLLGERQDIPNTLYDDYSAAGVIHILSISGLHVGILLLLLHSALFPLNYSRHSRILKFPITISILWFFAIIAGLTPSVVRATTMFSFLAFSMQLRRTPDVKNTLFASMFTLLLIKPGFLFDIGFQMSYAAVFSIVYFHPVLMSLWNPKNSVLRYLWQLAGVSFTAQLGVLPLSLYYFHQFPVLFLPINMIVVPLTGLIMSAGIAVLILASTGLLPSVFVDIYSFLVSAMNALISFAGRLDHFIFKDIYFSGNQLAVSYLVIASLLLLSVRKTRGVLLVLGSSIALLIILTAHNYLYPPQKEEFIIWHQYRKTLITRQSGATVIAYRSLDSLPLKKVLGDFIREERIHKIDSSKLLSSYTFKNQSVLYINQSDIQAYLSIPQADYLLLSQSPKINLERLLLYHRPKAVIADGDNAQYLVALWRSTCTKKKLPFHSTYEKGAYIVQP